MTIEGLLARGAQAQGAADPELGELLVVGAGSIGRTHLHNLRELAPQRPLRVLRSGLGRDLPPSLEALPVEHDLATALARRPSAVVVANPTALHLDVALAAARAGAHLLIEKPVAHVLAGTAALAAEVAQRELHTLVGFQFRFHPTLALVKEWLDDGAIGRVASVRVHWGEWLPGWHPDEDYRRGYSARATLGGGVVLTLCHPFDYLRWLCGEVEAVSAECGRLSGLELDVEDTAQVMLRFRSGALGVVSLDYLARPPVHNLEIVGQRGVLRWSNHDGLARLERVGRGACHSAHPPPGFARNDLFRAELGHFLGLLAGRASSRCPLSDGLAALRIALAAKRSAREGRRVSLDEAALDAEEPS